MDRYRISTLHAYTEQYVQNNMLTDSLFMATVGTVLNTSVTVSDNNKWQMCSSCNFKWTTCTSVTLTLPNLFTWISCLNSAQLLFPVDNGFKCFIMCYSKINVAYSDNSVVPCIKRKYTHNMKDFRLPAWQQPTTDRSTYVTLVPTAKIVKYRHNIFMII
jgi:hypothetical protein